MIEVGDALRTWALADEPRAGATFDAVALADHRLAYLTYEGPVSKDRGSVTRWDEGSYEVLEELADCLRLRLHGGKFAGVVTLKEVTSPTEEAQRWLVSFLKS